MQRKDIILLIIAVAALVVSLTWIYYYDPPKADATIIIAQVTDVPAPEAKAAIKQEEPDDTETTATEEHPGAYEEAQSILDEDATDRYWNISDDGVQEEPAALSISNEQGISGMDDGDEDAYENGEETADQSEGIAEDLVVAEPDDASGNIQESGISLGEFRITFYCPGECCCGTWAYGATASGVYPTANHTVACGEEIPFGAVLLIDGCEYVCEDRGVPDGCIDIFVDTHEEALAGGLYYTEVYLVDEY